MFASALPLRPPQSFNPLGLTFPPTFPYYNFNIRQPLSGLAQGPLSQWVLDSGTTHHLAPSLSQVAHPSHMP